MGTKKILFLSYDGMTDPLGQSQVLPYLSNLTKHGFEFTILSFEKPDRYLANKEYVLSGIEPFPIKWIPMMYHKNPPLLSSIYDFYLMKKTAIKLHKTYQFDLVHTRVGLPTLTGLWLKQNMGLKFLNDIRGFWADERKDGGIWNVKNPIYKRVYNFFKKKELEYVIHADYNVCLTYAAQKDISTWKGVSASTPVEVIPCSVDLDLFNPEKIDLVERKKLQEELNIKDDDFIVSYLGSIGGWYLTDEMIRFCKLLSDKMPKAKFLFISPHKHDVIVAAAAKFGLAADKLLVKHGKRQEVPLLLSFSNYSIFFIKPCYSKMSSSPTKHGEIMAMGIPIITNSGVGDVDEIVKKYEAGYIANDFSESTFEEIISKISKEQTFNRAQIRNGAKEFYSLNIAVDRYRSVYNKIFNA